MPPADRPDADDGVHPRLRAEGGPARETHPSQRPVQRRGSILRRIGAVIRYGLLTLVICVLSAALLLALKLFSPPAYTASTLIRPYLLHRETPKDVSQQSLDEKMIIDSAVQIIESQPLVRNVVQKLRLDEGPRTPSILLAPLRYLQPSEPAEQPTPLDMATRDIGRRLLVTTPRKSHLIEVAFTASSPERAAEVVNAVASEYIRFNKVAELAKAYSRAQSQQNELAARYNAQHPRVVAAKAEAELLLAAMTAEERADGLMTPQELVSTGLVIPAATVSIPSNRNLLPTAALGIVLGLLLSLGLILLCKPALRDAVRRFFG